MCFYFPFLSGLFFAQVICIVSKTNKVHNPTMNTSNFPRVNADVVFEL